MGLDFVRPFRNGTQITMFQPLHLNIKCDSFQKHDAKNVQKSDGLFVSPKISSITAEIILLCFPTARKTDEN